MLQDVSVLAASFTAGVSFNECQVLFYWRDSILLLLFQSRNSRGRIR